MTELSNKEKRDIIEMNIKQLEGGLYNATIKRTVAEKCGESKEAEAAIKQADKLVQKIAGYKELLAGIPEDAAKESDS